MHTWHDFEATYFWFSASHQPQQIRGCYPLVVNFLSKPIVRTTSHFFGQRIKVVGPKSYKFAAILSLVSFFFPSKHHLLSITTYIFVCVNVYILPVCEENHAGCVHWVISHWCFLDIFFSTCKSWLRLLMW